MNFFCKEKKSNDNKEIKCLIKNLIEFLKSSHMLCFYIFIVNKGFSSIFQWWEKILRIIKFKKMCKRFLFYLFWRYVMHDIIVLDEIDHNFW